MAGKYSPGGGGGKSCRTKFEADGKYAEANPGGSGGQSRRNRDLGTISEADSRRSGELRGGGLGKESARREPGEMPPALSPGFAVETASTRAAIGTRSCHTVLRTTGLGMVQKKVLVIGEGGGWMTG